MKGITVCRYLHYCVQVFALLCAGNCLAGGAFVAICCDYCLMSPERGRFGFPEVTMRIKYAVPFLNIIK